MEGAARRVQQERFSKHVCIPRGKTGFKSRLMCSRLEKKESNGAAGWGSAQFPLILSIEALLFFLSATHIT